MGPLPFPVQRGIPHLPLTREKMGVSPRGGRVPPPAPEPLCRYQPKSLPSYILVVYYTKDQMARQLRDLQLQLAQSTAAAPPAASPPAASPPAASPPSEGRKELGEKPSKRSKKMTDEEKMEAFREALEAGVAVNHRVGWWWNRYIESRPKLKKAYQAMTAAEKRVERKKWAQSEFTKLEKSLVTKSEETEGNTMDGEYMRFKLMFERLGGDNEALDGAVKYAQKCIELHDGGKTGPKQTPWVRKHAWTGITEFLFITERVTAGESVTRCEQTVRCNGAAAAGSRDAPPPPTGSGDGAGNGAGDGDGPPVPVPVPVAKGKAKGKSKNKSKIGANTLQGIKALKGKMRSAMALAEDLQRRVNAKDGDRWTLMKPLAGTELGLIRFPFSHYGFCIFWLTFENCCLRVPFPLLLCIVLGVSFFSFRVGFFFAAFRFSLLNTQKSCIRRALWATRGFRSSKP